MAKAIVFDRAQDYECRAAFLSLRRFFDEFPDMKPISVLFYIEPVCYRFDPLMLRPCAEWILSLMHSDREDKAISFAVASSPFLLSVLDEAPILYRRYEINPRDLTAPFNFDRHAYGRDLYGREADKGTKTPLPDILEKIKQDFLPDIVITFAQNRYIESMFTDRHILFWEMGPLPRLGWSECYYIDPHSAHGAKNLLNSQTERILNLPFDKTAPEKILDRWNKTIIAIARARARAGDIKQWLDEKRQGRKVVLFAMQPSDWLTYEAAYDIVAQDGLMMRWLNDLPQGWMAISTHHAHFRSANIGTAIKATAKLFPALEPMPKELLDPPEFAMSEVLMPHVDAVATLSSAVGMTGLLSGKPVVAYGQCYLNGLCARSLRDLPNQKPLNERERASLLMFLTNFYCHSTKDVLLQKGYFGKMIRKILEASDPLEPYFDFSDWSLERMEKLLVDRQNLM